ncbi:MAG TPA: cytochrome c [Gemmataceae bacterium]|jgi:mono/diheme cytochrome c family protein
MNILSLMTSPERQRRAEVARRWRSGLVVVILPLCLLTTACQQEMARQPYYRPLEKTDFFADGRSSRPLVEGTVPWRGRADGTASILTYRKSPEYTDAARAVALVGNPAMNVFGALLPFTVGPSTADYVDACPIDIDRAALERGQQRFNIYCAVCHDALGTGNGKIVERGYLQPPNYHSDYSRGFERRGQKVLLREAPIGYFFEVITRGFGGMPDYASQIPPDDRWKIVAYIRVLQRSQWVPLKDLPKNEQDTIKDQLRSLEDLK